MEYVKRKSNVVFAIAMAFMMLFSSLSVYADAPKEGDVVTKAKFSEAFDDKELNEHWATFGLTAQDVKNMSAYATSKANTSGDFKDKNITKGQGDGVHVPYVYKNEHGQVVFGYATVAGADNINKIASKGQSEYVQGEIGDLVAQIDIQPDMQSAAEIMESFREPISTFLGVLCFVIVFGLAVFTSLDICYITIPAFQGWSNMQAENGKKGMSRTSGNGDVRPSFVTHAALEAVKAENMADGEGGNALSVYFKSRMAVYILVAICIWMLLGNNITLITDIVLKLLSGIMGLVSNFTA